MQQENNSELIKCGARIQKIPLKNVAQASTVPHNWLALWHLAVKFFALTRKYRWC